MKMTKRVYKLIPYECIDGDCLVIHEKRDDVKLGALSFDHSSVGDAIVGELNELSDENENLKKENHILKHFFELVYYDYMIRYGVNDDKELMEMSNAFQSKDLRQILRFCIGENDKSKLKYYSELYKVDLK